jgi:hypothetical protein
VAGSFLSGLPIATFEMLRVLSTIRGSISTGNSLTIASCDIICRIALVYSFGKQQKGRYMIKFPFLNRHTILNHKEVTSSETCGCYKCLHIFTPEDMSTEDWWEESNGQLTAACPRCGIDSIVGSASGYPITHEVLKAMHTEKFGLYWAFARDGQGYELYDGKTGTWSEDK